MKGKDLVEWIGENRAEEHVILVIGDDWKYLKVDEVWEGEAGGGAIMLKATEEWVPEVDEDVKDVPGE